MVTKSKKAVAKAKTELRVNTTRTSGKQKKEKKKKSKKDATSPIKSIKKSLRNGFQKIKGSGGKKQGSVASISNTTSSMASELDDSVFHPSQGLSSPKVSVKELPQSPGKKRSSANRNRKKAPSSTAHNIPATVREVRKSKGKKELPTPQKPSRKDLKTLQPKEKYHRRPKTVEHGTDLRRGYAMNKGLKKRLSSGKRESREQRNNFRSFSNSTGYSDSDFNGDYGSDASSVYSSYSVSESDSESDSDSSNTSSSYTTEEEGLTMRTERCVLNRNPEAKRGRSRNPRRKQSTSTTPIRSPRSPQSSPKKDSSHHIRSPKRSGRNTGRFFPDDDVDVSNSDGSSFVTTSYDSSESESDSETSRSCSDSCFSESESPEESETNSEYYTTSYDDSRNLQDSTYSTSWTDRPVSTYGSEETERTSFTNQKRQDHYPTLLGDPSGSDDSYPYESRSTMGDSRDLGSIDEKEYSEFVKEQEAAEKIEKERAAIAEKRKKELEEAQKQKEQQTNSSGGMFSWIFGGSSASTEPTLEKKTEKVDKNEEEALKGESGTKDDHITDPKSPIQTRKEDETSQIISSPMNSQRSTGSLRSPKSALSPRSPRSPPLSPRTPRSAASPSRNDFITRDRRSAIFLEDDCSNRVGDQSDEVDPAMSPGCSINLSEILGVEESLPESYGGLEEGEFLLSNLGSDSVDKAEANGEAMSFTMRGSGTFGSPTGALQEIAFSPQSPSVMSSPTRSRRVESFFPGGRDGDDDILYCCCPSERGQRLDLPDLDIVEKDFIRSGTTGNEGTTYNTNDDVISALVEDPSALVDDTTCASTINTEGFQDIKDVQAVNPSSKLAVSQSSNQEVVNEEKNPHSFMIPVNAEEYKDDIDNVSYVSCDAEEIEIELLDNVDKVSSSTEETEIELQDEVVSPPNDAEIEEEDQEQKKRIKAECLDDYEISEILHGKRAYKSKTDEDGHPIPVSRFSTQTGRRERRQNALKAHREFLYKSYSIDTNTEAPKEGAKNTDERSRTDSIQAIYGDEGNKTSTGESKTTSGDTSTEGPSVLSNSIVQDDSAIPNDAEQPDALTALVRNAFNNMMSPTNDATTAPSVLPSPSSPLDDVLEVAYRFFSPPKEVSPILSDTQRGKNEALEIINFDPNPGVRPVVKETAPQVKSTEKAIEKEIDDSSQKQSNQTHSVEGSSSSLDATNVSDEAVLRNSRSKTSINIHDVVLDESRFNADGIPLELRPKKIWRAFDSGFSVSPSTNGQSITSKETKNDASTLPEPKTNENQESATLPEIVSKPREQNEAEAHLNQNDDVDGQLDSVIDKDYEDDHNKIEIGSQEHDPNLEQPQRPQVQPDMKVETKERKEESGSRLMSSARYRRRSEMRRLKNRRLHHEKTSKEYCPENTDGRRGESLSLSPRKKERESFEKNPIHSSLSPTKRQLGIFKLDLPQSKSCSNISNTNQGFDEPPSVIVVEERSDATLINDQQGEEPLNDRVPPSPPTTPAENITDTSYVSSSVSPRKDNVSDIRSRIKDRRRSNFQKQKQQQQQQNQQPQQQVATRKHRNQNVVSSRKGIVKQDRRHDSFNTMDNEDEFFDAINFDDNNDNDEESSIENKVMSPAKKYLSAPNFDNSYPGLSHKESILSAVMSLD